MGYYQVVASCVVGKLHYTRPTTAPIEVDDDVAAPLVESGCLTPYGRPVVEAEAVAEVEAADDESPAEVDEPDSAAEPAPRRRNRRG